MTQRKKLSSGFLLISIGIYGLITGNTIALEKGVLFSTVETDFPNFVIVISGLFAYGIISLISSTVDESRSRNYSEVFRESESYRRWIKIDEEINRSAFKSGCIGFSLSIRRTNRTGTIVSYHSHAFHSFAL